MSMNTALSGLTAAQTDIATTSHNIAAQAARRRRLRRGIPFTSCAPI
jgi:flagellar basal body rod protein FlgC